jgi:hypothetical protein
VNFAPPRLLPGGANLFPEADPREPCRYDEAPYPPRIGYPALRTSYPVRSLPPQHHPQIPVVRIPPGAHERIDPVGAAVVRQQRQVHVAVVLPDQPR